MLESLSLKNFKSWKEVKALRFGRITGLFGANSSGKTSLLQMLLLLKQTTEAADRSIPLALGDDRSLADLGTFRDVLHGHDDKRELEWSLTWSLTVPMEIADPEQVGNILFRGDRLTHSACIGMESDSNGNGRMVTRRHAYRFSDTEFGMEIKTGENDEYEIFPTGGRKFRFVHTPGRVWPLPAPAKSYGFPDQVRGYYKNAGFLSDFELAFDRLFSGLFYLGPLREYPKRQYAWAGGKPSDMGRRGEKVVDALLASRDGGVTISHGRGRPRLTIEAQVAKWLKDLRLIHDFDVRPVARGSKLYEVVVKKTATSSDVLITDVGFGVSQILPVITLCYYAPEGSVLIFEQPEIHLHPAVQAGMADVFIHAVQARNIQIILESHSEHLLRRLQRRVAEQKLSSDDMALYFCDIQRGESRLIPLDLDLFGSIKNWPADFFGDEFGELAATQEAIAKRQQGRTE